MFLNFSASNLAIISGCKCNTFSEINYKKLNFFFVISLVVSACSERLFRFAVRRLAGANIQGFIDLARVILMFFKEANCNTRLLAGLVRIGAESFFSLKWIYR